MKRIIYSYILSLLITLPTVAENRTIDMTSFGVRPGSRTDMAWKISAALRKIESKYGKEDLTLEFAPGEYHLYQKYADKREYYISNHDQTNPKSVGIDLSGWKNITLDATDADFIFHGRMLPMAVTKCSGCTIKGFSIDFENPHISQVEIISNDESGITFRPEEWVKYRISKEGRFISSGEGWELAPSFGMAFDPETRHILYNTGDIFCRVDSVIREGSGLLRAPRWHDRRLLPGTKVIMRTGQRPAPGIFISLCKDIRVENVKVHYAEGMGLLAQISENVTLDGFGVCLRGDNDPRFFTTQADATHFSGCKGHISSCNGLYEGMMDDAINIHGTYLKVVGREGERTLVGRYMHHQSYGFFWGEPGDTVSFIASRTMEPFDRTNIIESITPHGTDKIDGALEFSITFRDSVPAEITPEGSYGMENLSWSPSATFTGNTIRNNRARGSLFSTPRPVVVDGNLFDHTSGCAILLCGDCNGWYETGACRDVKITNNRFVNALTCRFQFTEAIISIYPEIPDLENQKKYFHGGENSAGIVITGNRFETFDSPILYAKSTDKLFFSGNTIHTTTDFKPYHPNKFTFSFERVKNAFIHNNSFDHPDEVSISFR